MGEIEVRTELLIPKVKASLLKAGWRPERRADELVFEWETVFFRDGGFELFPSARRVLLELGGLTFEQDGPGETVARRSFNFDPTGADGESDRFADFEEALGVRLCPVGEADDGESFLAIAEDGRVLCVMDDGWIIGEGIEEALASLILGKIGEPVYCAPGG